MRRTLKVLNLYDRISKVTRINAIYEEAKENKFSLNRYKGELAFLKAYVRAWDKLSHLTATDTLYEHIEDVKANNRDFMRYQINARNR